MGASEAICFLVIVLTVHCCQCRTLRVAGIGVKPYLDLENWKDDLPTGAEMELTKTIANKLGYNLTFTATRVWGRKMPNGSWTGTLGRVVDGHADIGVGQLLFTVARSHDVHYTHFSDSDSCVIHSAKPLPLPPYMNLIKPFTPELWIFFLLSPPTAAAIISGIQSDSLWEWPIRTLDISIELLAMVLCQARSAQFLHKKKFLPFLLSWLAFSSLMHMAYDCNLRSYLMSVAHQEPVDRLEDIEKLGKTLYLLKGAFFTDWFLESGHPVHLKLIPDALRSNRFITLDTGLPLWFDEKMAFENAVSFLPLTWYTNRLGIIRERFGSIPFQTSKEKLASYYVGMILSRDDPELNKVFDKYMLYLKDNGVLHKNLNTESVAMFEEKRASNKDVPLGLRHLLFGILTYCIMMIISFVILFFERKSKKMGKVSKMA